MAAEITSTAEPTVLIGYQLIALAVVHGALAGQSQGNAGSGGTE